MNTPIMNLCNRLRIVRPAYLGNFCRYSNTVSEINTDLNDQPVIDESEEARAREAEIEKKRNVSRLSAAHYNLIHDRRPYKEPMHLSHLTVKYNRKLYGKYGAESGVNPSICWPTNEDIEETLEYESVAYPFTIKEMMAMAAQKRKEAKEKIELREKELAEKFAKLDQWKKELNDRIEKKAVEANAAKIRKERLVEEVRRHFGFTLDPRDERFKEMLAKREKEMKKQEKQAKKDAKEKLLLAKLQQKNIEMNETQN
ncbi:hypothetical protein ACJJTC_000117 [Scirpophaga incertulas]